MVLHSHCISLQLSLSQLTFNAQPLPSLLRLYYRPSCYRHEYEQTDVTAGRPYATSLSDLYALIIPSCGTNIDILGLNIQTLQTASLRLALSVSWQPPSRRRKALNNGAQLKSFLLSDSSHCCKSNCLSIISVVYS